MTAHLELQIQYAKEHLAWLEDGAKEGKEPWREWQCSIASPLAFGSLMSAPNWYGSMIYRRKPRTITINGVTINAPMRDEPKDGNYYGVSGNGSVFRGTYNSSVDREYFLAANCWHTEADAIAFRDLMRGILRGEK